MNFFSNEATLRMTHFSSNKSYLDSINLRSQIDSCRDDLQENNGVSQKLRLEAVGNKVDWTLVVTDVRCFAKTKSSSEIAPYDC